MKLKCETRTESRKPQQGKMTVLSESSAALAQHLHCRSVQQENEIELRDVN